MYQNEMLKNPQNDSVNYTQLITEQKYYTVKIFVRIQISDNSTEIIKFIDETDEFSQKYKRFCRLILVRQSGDKCNSSNLNKVDDTYVKNNHAAVPWAWKTTMLSNKEDIYQFQER